MTEPSIADQISHLETEVFHLRVKSQADDETVDLLKTQVSTLTREADEARQNFTQEVRRLRQERDEALAKVSQVSGMIQSICKLGLEGITRLQQRPLSPGAGVQEMAEHIPPRPVPEPRRTLSGVTTMLPLDQTDPPPIFLSPRQVRTG